jgi:hypothetical protein
MADKSKMKCNRVVASDRPGKKRMVKACEGGKEKLIHFGAKGYKNLWAGKGGSTKSSPKNRQGKY